MTRARAALVAAILMLASGCVTAGSPVAVDDDTIEVFGPWRGADADRFAELVAPFEASTGIDVRYVGSVDFVSDLRQRAGEASDPPDVAIVPQAGLIRDLASKGWIVPLQPGVETAVEDNLDPEIAALGEVDGTGYGLPFRITIKSLVWYRPDLFAARGWSIPETLDELQVLVDRIATAGDIVPWCAGIQAGSATGWVATDWSEDLVLRTVGPERYQGWASGDIGFADPDIAAAFTMFRSLVLEPGRALGGVRGVIETPVDESVLPLFENPPQCALHRQADFAANWFPDGTSIGSDGDVNFFVLPAATAGTGDGPPIVVGSDQAVQFRTGENIDAFMTYLAGPEAAAIWARRGGFISPNLSLPDDAYPDDHHTELARALEDSTAVVFDASDQMPPAIGSDLLWARITDWVANIDDYPTFAVAIDTARAESES